MGFWKEVSMDMRRGMSKEKAVELNAQLRYGNLSREEKEKLTAKAEADVKLNTLK